MNTIIQIVIAALLFSIVASVKADKYHHQPLVLEVSEVTNQVTNVTEVTDYSYDDCQSVAIGQAAASAQMYFGTNKPQISLGMGECGGDWAGSLRGGMKLRNNLMFNGAWSFDEDVNAFGLGATFIFK